MPLASRSRGAKRPADRARGKIVYAVTELRDRICRAGMGGAALYSSYCHVGMLANRHPWRRRMVGEGLITDLSTTDDFSKQQQLPSGTGPIVGIGRRLITVGVKLRVVESSVTTALFSRVPSRAAASRPYSASWPG